MEFMQPDAVCYYACYPFEDRHRKDISNIWGSIGYISGYAFCKVAMSLPYRAFGAHDCSLSCDYDALWSNLRTGLYFQ